MRARDIDRINARTLIDSAYAEGQLGADDYRDRCDSAARAATLEQLLSLLADLQLSTAARDDAPVGRSCPPPRSDASYPPGTRARDSDRIDTCTLLDQGLGDGQLTVEEHQVLSDLAGAAVTLGDLRVLIEDLQVPSDRPARGARGRWARLGRHRFAAGVTIIALAAGMLCFRMAADDEPISKSPPLRMPASHGELDGIAPRVVATPKLVTREGVALFISNYRLKFGDTTVDELALFDEHATVRRQLPQQPNRMVQYSYRGGFDLTLPPSTRRTDTPTWDIGTVDLDALGRALARLPTTVQVPDAVVSHISFTIDRTTAGSAGRPVVRIFANNTYGESGYVTLDQSGSVVDVSPFRR